MGWGQSRRVRSSVKVYVWSAPLPVYFLSSQASPIIEIVSFFFYTRLVLQTHTRSDYRC